MGNKVTYGENWIHRGLKAIALSAVLCVAFTGIPANALGAAGNQGKTVKMVSDIPVQDRLEAMVPVFDTLLLTYSELDGKEYSPADSEYYCTAMYLMLANYGPYHALSEIEGDYASISRMVVYEYETALFYDNDGTLQEELGTEKTPGIAAGKSHDLITVYLSDAGEVETRILNMEQLSGNNYRVTAQLWSPSTGEVLYTGKFDLKPNPYVDAVVDPVYFYSVYYADIWPGEA